MPYDSSLPADHAQIVAAELRNQLNGLADMIPSGGITQHQLDDAIATQTAGSVLGIVPLTAPINDPPTAEDVLAQKTKINEILAALQRQ